MSLSLPWSAQEQHRTGSAQDTGFRFHRSSRHSVPASAGQQAPSRHGTATLAHNRLPFGTGFSLHRNQHSRVPGPAHPGIRNCSAESNAGIAAYSLQARRTPRADEPVMPEAYVYPPDGQDSNLWHLCRAQQGALHRARLELNVLQSESSSRLPADA